MSIARRAELAQRQKISQSSGQSHRKRETSKCMNEKELEKRILITCKENIALNNTCTLKVS